MFPTNDRLKLTPSRVWKGIFGILDLTNIRREIWENAKYLGGKWDLTGTREADSQKFGHGMRDFFPSLSGNRGIVTTKIHVLAANAIQ